MNRRGPVKDRDGNAPPEVFAAREGDWTLSSTGVADVVTELRDRLPAAIMIEGGEIGPRQASLFAEEEAMLTNPAPTRLHEFRAGRAYARRALERLGAAPGPIPIGPTRAPIWPVGFVGSISHAGTWCVAAAALAARRRGVGVDIEDSAPLDDDLVSLVAHPGELAARNRVETRLGHDLPKLVFVIKEAFYKMYHPLTGSFLTFLDVSAELTTENGLARVSLGTGGAVAEGCFGCRSGILYAYFDQAAL